MSSTSCGLLSLWTAARPVALPLAIPREPIDLSDRCSPLRRRLLDLAVATAAEPRAVSRESLPHQRFGDVGPSRRQIATQRS